MVEYFIFTKYFSPVTYLIRPLNLDKSYKFNKPRIIEHEGQIPSKFKNKINFPINIDEGYLNCLQNLTIKQYIYLYKSDYLQLILFLKHKNLLEYGTKYGGPNVSHYVFNIFKHNTYKLNDYLLVATKYRNKYMVKLLVDSFELDIDSAFEISCEVGSFEIAKCLIEKGASFNVENLYAAILVSNLQIIQLLIDKGLDIRDGKALEFSFQKRKYKAAEVLIRNGSNVNVEMEYCVYIAFYYKKYKLLKLLFEYGATGNRILFYHNLKFLKLYIKYNVLNDEQKILFFNQTCLYGDYKAFLYLLENTTNIDLPISDFLISACIYDNKFNMEENKLLIVKKLIEMGADINSKNGSPLCNAVHYYSIVKYLIQNGANVNLPKSDLLIEAIYINNYAVVKLLIDNGADVNIQEGQPLILACYKNFYSIAEYLVNNGADVTFNDSQCLSEATINENDKLIKFLIKKGANVNCYNRSPFKYALNKQKYKLLKFLIEKGATIIDKDLFKAIEIGNLKFFNLLYKNFEVSLELKKELKNAASKNKIEIII